MIKINFSFEFFLNKTSIFKILKLKKKIILKPKILTLTYNKLKINKNIINYYIYKKIKMIPHIICKGKLLNFNYLINFYYLNNSKKILLIKGDEKKNNNYYTYNFLKLIKKNYMNKFIFYLACYPEYHPCALSDIYDIKNNIIKNIIMKNKTKFITQYFYNIDSYIFFFDNLNKLKKNLNIIPGILFINCLKRLIFFSNICRSELPSWIFKKFNFSFSKNIFKKISLEIILNLILKMLKLKFKNFHYYTMNNLNYSNNINENLNNILNL